MTDYEYEAWLPLNLEKYLLIVMGLAIFFYSMPARSVIASNSLNAYFNIFWIAVGSFLLLTYAMEKQLFPGIVILAFCYWSLAFLSNIVGNQNLFTHFATFFNSVFPLLLIGLCLKPEVIEPVAEGFLKGMNAMIILMVCFGIPDIMTGGMIQEFMISHVFDPDMAALAEVNLAAGVYRLFFVFGHPLHLAWIFLLFFSLNVLNNRYYKVLLSTPRAALITLLGLVLCNSRTALIIGTLMILLLNGERSRRWLYLTAVIALAAAILFVPVVRDNVAQRFINEMQGDSISGGRNEAVQMVFEGYAEPPGIILGQGLGHSRQIAKALGGFINSFEYPIIMYAYDYSITGTAILYAIILFIPLNIFIREKRWLEAGLFLALSLYMNGFNLLADDPDGIAQLCYGAMLMINMRRKHCPEMASHLDEDHESPEQPDDEEVEYNCIGSTA